MIERIADRYPQLYLAPEEGASKSDDYRLRAKEGWTEDGSLAHFIGSSKDRYALVRTPAGAVETLSFGLREDFVTALQILQYRCEPVEISGDVDAALLTGITDWEKIRAHKKAYLATGCTDWDKELRRFTADRSNCTSPILLLCEGPYRGLSPEEAGMSAEKWEKVSGSIRRYRELAAYVCAQKWQAKRNPKWDPIMTECIGIFGALKTYDDTLAKKLLKDPAPQAFRAVDALQETVCCWGGGDPFKLLNFLYHETDLYETVV